MQKEIITPAVASKALKIFQREVDNDGDPRSCMLQALKETLGSLIKYKGYHCPVCAACQTEMHPERNGVGVVDYADYGPVNLWEADLWECPKCHIQIVVGFGDYPISSHIEDDFDKIMELYGRESIIIGNH